MTNRLLAYMESMQNKNKLSIFKAPLPDGWEKQFNGEKERLKYLLYKIIYFVCHNKSSYYLINEYANRRMVQTIMGNQQEPYRIAKFKISFTTSWTTLKKVLDVLEFDREDYTLCSFHKLAKEALYCKKAFIVVRTRRYTLIDFFADTSVDKLHKQVHNYRLACATYFNPMDTLGGPDNKFTLLPKALQQIPTYGHFDSITFCDNKYHNTYRQVDIKEHEDIIDIGKFDLEGIKTTYLAPKFVWAIYVRNLQA